MLQTKIPEIDESIWRPHLANFAPLPEAFVRHIFAYPHAIKLPSYGKQEPPPLFDQIWKQIQVARETISYFLVAAVTAEARTQTERIVPDWFRREFERYSSSRALPRTTVQEWLNKHLLRSIKHSSLEPNSVASIYMMRYLFKREQRRWMPARQRMDAPWFYVWGLLPDEKMPRMYPYPLSPDLPANLLLYSQWIGASWHPGFVTVPGIGSLAWGKTREFAGDWYWDLDEEQMATWDADFVRHNNVKRRAEMLDPIRKSHPQGLPDSDQRYLCMRIHNNATTLLENIGEPILAGYMRHSFDGGKLPTRAYVPF